MKSLYFCISLLSCSFLESSPGIKPMRKNVRSNLARWFLIWLLTRDQLTKIRSVQTKWKKIIDLKAVRQSLFLTRFRSSKLNGLDFTNLITRSSGQGGADIISTIHSLFSLSKFNIYESRFDITKILILSFKIIWNIFTRTSSFVIRAFLARIHFNRPWAII